MFGIISTNGNIKPANYILPRCLMALFPRFQFAVALDWTLGTTTRTSRDKEPQSKYYS